MNNADAFEALVDAVSEQTGKPRGVCRSLIVELGAEIAKTVATGESVNIKGFGEFNTAQEKPVSISFQPSEDLQELVNAPYAHMKPELIEEEPPFEIPAEEELVSSPAEEETHTSAHGTEEPVPKEPALGSGYSFKNRYQREKKSQGSFWIIAAAFIILLLAVGAWYMIGLMSESSETPQQAAAVENVQNPETSTAQPPTSETPQKTQQNEEEDSQAEQQAATAADPQENGDNQDDEAATGQKQDQPEPSNQMITVTVERGQTLWGLADNQYENPYLWPWIYDTNIDIIDDPDIIYVGQALDIPLRSGAGQQLSDNDSLQVALAYVETYLWYKEQELDNARFYLYAAKRYHSRVFEYTEAELDPADLRFANRAQ